MSSLKYNFSIDLRKYFYLLLAQLEVLGATQTVLQDRKAYFALQTDGDFLGGLNFLSKHGHNLSSKSGLFAVVTSLT